MIILDSNKVLVLFEHHFFSALSRTKQHAALRQFSTHTTLSLICSNTLRAQLNEVITREHFFLSFARSPCRQIAVKLRNYHRIIQSSTLYFTCSIYDFFNTLILQQTCLFEDQCVCLVMRKYPFNDASFAIVSFQI